MAIGKKPIRWWLLLFVPILILLSGYLFFFRSLPASSTAADPAPLEPAWYKIETARGAILEEKSIVGNCFLCHAYWVPIPRSNLTSNPRFAHANIKLNHGTNDRCYNCHMISDRNKYVADDGSAIMVQLPEQLCKRCHGLIYNDWQLGTHGKWTGKWAGGLQGEKKIYTCTECHDPHDPKYKYAIIAPPPTWPGKYVRSKIDNHDFAPSASYLIGAEPKEIF